MSEKTRRWQAAPIAHWLMHEGRFLPEQEILGGLGRQFVREGAPVWRLSLGFRMLHPLLRASSALWTRDDDTVHTRRVTHETVNSGRYDGSPIQSLFENQQLIRQTIDAVSAKQNSFYAEMYDQAYTDYLGIPTKFSDDTDSYMIAATKRPGGFDDYDVDTLMSLSNFVAPVVETLARRELARSVLDTYVGPRTGQKVLCGMIGRGDSQLIEAALWFSDLRNFTHYTETLEATELLSLLNTYFEFVSAAVTARGGEILRFIGDAMLIVFPVEDAEVGVRAACAAALDSARDAFDSLATFNFRRRRVGLPEIDFGVGLNVGEVIYGNVGAPERLDFTVMGPAVNRVARLESLTKELAEPILMSRDFADAIDEQVRSLGFHAMKGVPTPQEVLAPG